MEENLIQIIKVLLTFLLLWSFTIAQNITIPKPISGLQRYDSSKAYNGYTVLSPILIRINEKTSPNIPIIDMNGNTVKIYKHIKYFAKFLPGGYAIGPSDDSTNILEAKAILESDWNDNILWGFDHWNRKSNGT